MKPAHAAWPRVRRVLTVAFFAAVAWLLVSHAREIDWRDVGAGMQALPLHILVAAAALAIASHTLFSCFDLIGRRYTGHRLPVRTVMGVNAISYAFNLNLGSLVGGVAFRYRLYSRLGLSNGTITRVMSLSMLTNWLGYLLLAGVIFMVWPPALPEAWKVGNDVLPYLGAVMVAVALCYVGLCFWRRGHAWQLRGHALVVPGWRMALLQVVVSCTNWLIMAAMVWTLLQGRIAYPDVVAVLLIAAMAGVITHVPAGLGVLEAVFIALLSSRMAQGELLAALLAYRGLYYLVPLAVATVGYTLMEARARRQAPPEVKPREGAFRTSPRNAAGQSFHRGSAS
jgi:uncharacterized membrane protein YbhN (UPF0104 family)